MDKQHIDILIDHGTVITMDPQRRIITDGCIAIANNVIVAVDTSPIINRQYQAHTIIDANQQAVLPGLINGHAHGATSLFRGIADDQSLLTWLKDYILPIEHAVLSPQFVKTGTELALLEMIQGGITTVADMYHYENTVAQTCADYGMRALVGYTITDQISQIRDAEEFITTWQHHPLIHPVAAPHSLYSVPENVLCMARDLAKATNTPLMLHFAESAGEADIIKNKYHLSSCEVLEKTKLLDNQLILAHAIHLTEEEIALLSKHSVSMIHCPTSNMKLGSGVAPITIAQKYNIPIGLGSDGAASNNVLNMFGEMKTATLLQRVMHQSGSMLSATKALEFATIEGARALLLDRHIGSIEPGKYADIITVSLSASNQIPVYDVISTLVYATYPTDVQTVIMSGVIKMAQGKLTCASDYIAQVFERVKMFRSQIILENSLIHD